jgi:hypothetical protein
MIKTIIANMRGNIIMLPVPIDLEVALRKFAEAGEAIAVLAKRRPLGAAARAEMESKRIREMLDVLKAQIDENGRELTKLRRREHATAARPAGGWAHLFQRNNRQ